MNLQENIQRIKQVMGLNEALNDTREPIDYESRMNKAKLLMNKVNQYLDSIGYTQANDTHTIYKSEKNGKFNPECVYETKVFARPNINDFDGDETNTEDMGVYYFLRIHKIDEKFDKNKFKAILKSVEPNSRAYWLQLKKYKTGVKLGVDIKIHVKFPKFEK